MDPVDAGLEPPTPKAWKEAVSYTRYPTLDPRRWEGKGFPERIEKLVSEGAAIDVHEPADPLDAYFPGRRRGKVKTTRQAGEAE